MKHGIEANGGDVRPLVRVVDLAATCSAMPCYQRGDMGQSNGPVAYHNVLGANWRAGLKLHTLFTDRAIRSGTGQARRLFTLERMIRKMLRESLS
jgi:hypothetical protein